jgi:dTDP-glucose pyrophosphorylase
VTLVTGHLAEQVERFAGDGSAWGMPLTTVRQARPDGSADAVATAGEAAPYLVLGADTVFSPGEIGRFAATFSSSGAGGALAVRRRRPDEPRRNGVELESGLVRRLRAAESPLAGAPLWAVGPVIAALADALPGEPPYELASAFQQAIDAGEGVAGIEIGPTRGLTGPGDLLLENFPYLQAL